MDSHLFSRAKSIVPNAVWDAIKASWFIWGPSIAGGAILVWSILSQLPAPIAVVLALVTVTAILLLSTCVMVMFAGLALVYANTFGRKLQSTANATSLSIYSPQDALDHVLIDGHRELQLDIDQHDNGWPIMFPILVRNTRLFPIEIIGFSIEVFGDGLKWHGIAWSISNGSVATNGGTVRLEDRMGGSPPIKVDNTIPGDDFKVIRIPIYVAQVQPKQPQSPSLKVSGTLLLRCKQENRDIDIPDYHFRPKLSQDRWEGIVTHVQP